MKQILLMVSVVLLGLSWAVARDSSTPTSSSNGTQQSASQSRTGAGGEMTVEGCVSGSNGSFTLTDKNGMAYQLTGDTAKLSEHVGHEVKITGMSGSGASGSDASTSGGSGQTLQVSSIKHISKTCKSGGMTH